MYPSDKIGTLEVMFYTAGRTALTMPLEAVPHTRAYTGFMESSKAELAIVSSL